MDRRQPLKSSPDDVVAALIGRPIWGPRRAADMQIFDFGGRVPVVDRHGRERTKGEYGLHIQSRWRFVRAGEPFVTSEDLWRQTTDAPDAPLDSNLGSRTLRDELLDRFVLDSSVRDLTVEQATVTDAGGLLIRLRGGAVLEVDAEEESGLEAWRVLRPDGSHAVMVGPRFEIERPEAS